jgi:hypothetical protein
MKTRLYANVLLAAVLSNSCDRLCGDGTPANVSGGWQLSGEGSCINDDGYDTNVGFTGDMSLAIVQSADGSDLELAAPVPVKDGTFTFSGRVNGSCADFTIEERGPGYSASYTFKGVVQGTTIEGDVSGTGTGICPFEGDFKVSVFGNTPPRPDGGVFDAGTSTTSTTTTTPECYASTNCDFGVCQGGSCVAVCSIASDCSTGEKCLSGRCELADGCNCNSTTDTSRSAPWSWFSLLVLALKVLRRTPSSRPIFKAKSRTRESSASAPR